MSDNENIIDDEYKRSRVSNNDTPPILDPLTIAVICGNYTKENTYREIIYKELTKQINCRSYNYTIEEFKIGKYYTIYSPMKTFWKYKCKQTTLIEHLDNMRMEKGLAWGKTIEKIQNLVTYMKKENKNHELIFTFLRTEYTSENLYDLLYRDFIHTGYPLLIMCTRLEDIYYYNYLQYPEYRRSHHDLADYYMNNYIYFSKIYKKNREIMYCSIAESKKNIKLLQQNMHLNDDMIEIIVSKAYVLYTEEEIERIMQEYKDKEEKLEFAEIDSSIWDTPKTKIYDEIENKYLLSQPYRELFK